MPYECIDPEKRDGICEMMEGSIEEIAAFDFGGPGEIWKARWHWNCCPACRNEFPSLPAVLEQAGRKIEHVFAASLCLMKDHFLAQKTSLATAGSDGNAYPAMIAALANEEDEVHHELQHALLNATALYSGEEVEFDAGNRPLLPQKTRGTTTVQLDPGLIMPTTCSAPPNAPPTLRISKMLTRKNLNKAPESKSEPEKSLFLRGATPVIKTN
jgi:hypothetical protein